MALKASLPMRPNPLMPILVVICLPPFCSGEYSNYAGTLNCSSETSGSVPIQLEKNYLCRLSQRVFFSIFLCLCFAIFFFRHLSTEPIHTPSHKITNPVAAVVDCDSACR